MSSSNIPPAHHNSMGNTPDYSPDNTPTDVLKGDYINKVFVLIHMFEVEKSLVEILHLKMLSPLPTIAQWVEEEKQRYLSLPSHSQSDTKFLSDLDRIDLKSPLVSQLDEVIGRINLEKKEPQLKRLINKLMDLLEKRRPFPEIWNDPKYL